MNGLLCDDQPCRLAVTCFSLLQEEVLSFSSYSLVKKKKKKKCSIYYSNSKPLSKIRSLPSLSSLYFFSYPSLLIHFLWSLWVWPVGAPLFSTMTQSVSKGDSPSIALTAQNEQVIPKQPLFFDLTSEHLECVNTSSHVPQSLYDPYKGLWVVLLKYASLALRAPP